MKALSVRQPWASMIASGEKTLELRSWPIKHRGELLICSSLRPEPGATPSQPLGVAVVIVDVVDCRPFEPIDARAACCPYEPGYYAWELRVLYRVEPVPVKGRLSLFDVPLTVIRKSFRMP